MANTEQIALLRKGIDHWNRWRRDDLLKPQSSEADFSRADFSRAILARVNLSRANLRRADLSGAILWQANLRLATLIEADLSGAYLNEANLSDADLSRANLSGAHILKATLSRANLTWAQLSATSFGDIDLRSVKGLELVEHGGPSHIGIDTIYRSNGEIPEIFLRGAGVPEPFIVQMKALVSAMQPIQFYSCFISYSHTDKSFARRLHDALQGQGIRCWLDEQQLLPGDDIYDQVDRSIRLWDKVLLCCSKASLTSWWVDNEIATAFKKGANERARPKGARPDPPESRRLPVQRRLAERKGNAGQGAAGSRFHGLGRRQSEI